MTRTTRVVLIIAALALVVSAAKSAWDFGQDQAADRKNTQIALRVLRSDCLQTNIVRNNQYHGLSDQIKETERSLRGSLNGLEKFRPAIERGLKLRKERRADLIKVRYRPHQKDEPWKINCARLPVPR